MKAICIKQPWAGLIAEGEKTIETRTWQTNHRGPLLIVASLGLVQPMYNLMKDWYVKEHGFLPHTYQVLGAALCIVDLFDCKPMTKSDQAAACCDIYPGAYSWHLRNVQIIKPFEVKGQLKIFEIGLK